MWRNDEHWNYYNEFMGGMLVVTDYTDRVHYEDNEGCNTDGLGNDGGDNFSYDNSGKTEIMLTIKEMTQIAVTMVGLTTGQDRSSCGGGRCSRPLPTLGSTDTMEMATQTSRLNEAKNSCSLHWPVAEPV